MFVHGNLCVRVCVCTCECILLTVIALECGENVLGNVLWKALHVKCIGICACVRYA